MTVFNVITGLIARWLHRQLVRGEATLPVIAAFSGLLFVFTVANLAIGVALAPRYAEPSPDRRLRQQPGPADHQHVRRDHLRAELRRVGRHAVHRAAGRLLDSPPRGQGRGADVPPVPPTPQARLGRRPPRRRHSRGRRSPLQLPRIVRLKEDSTTVLAAPPTQEIAAPTAALRIQRRERSSEPTIGLPTPPDDADGTGRRGPDG